MNTINTPEEIKTTQLEKKVIYTAKAHTTGGREGGASDLFVQLFGPEARHVRLVYGVQSLPIGAPVIVDVISSSENGSGAATD